MTTKISWLSFKQLCWQPIFQDDQSFKAIEDQGNFFVMSVGHDQEALAGGKNHSGPIAGECMSLGEGKREGEASQEVFF